MTQIKFCGLSRPCHIKAANELHPDYIGFVFAKKSSRAVTTGQAAELKGILDPHIKAVGVFVNENPETVAQLLNSGIIDMAQLHGDEDESYIRQLRLLTHKPMIQAFRIGSECDGVRVETSTADVVLLDSGAGTGVLFDWKRVEKIQRPYFLAGGLDPENVGQAVKELKPYAVDVSSGIESEGVKDVNKMAAFAAAVRAVRKEE